MADNFVSGPVRGPMEYRFRLDGEEFTCRMGRDADSILEWSELAGAAMGTGNVQLESAAGLAFFAQFFRLVMGDAEYGRFRAHLKLHSTSPRVLMDIMQTVNERMQDAVEAETDRPTMPSSPSSRGRGGRDERTARILSIGGGDMVAVEAPHLPPGPPVDWPADMPHGPVGGSRNQRRRRRAG